jgi:hypothetical protein
VPVRAHLTRPPQHGGDLVVFLIAWGLGASVIGVLMLVNFRGVRDRSDTGHREAFAYTSAPAALAVAT